MARELSKEYIGDWEGIFSLLENREEHKQDFVVESKNLKMIPVSSGVKIAIDGKDLTSKLAQNRFTPNDFAHRQIASKLNIPVKYYNRMLEDDQELLAHNVNTWLRGNDRRRYFLRTYDDNGELRTLLSDRYQVIDNFPILRSVADSVSKFNGISMHRTRLGDDKLYLDIHNRDEVEELKATGKVGDEIFGGIVITNSDVGGGALQVLPQIIRLACINGMIFRSKGDESLRTIHLGSTIQAGVFSEETRLLEQDVYLRKLSEAIPAALDGDVFQEFSNTLVSAQGKLIEDPVKAVENVTLKHRFTEKERDHLLGAFGGYDNTQYGLSQAVAQVGRDMTTPGGANGVDQNYNRGIELREVAAVVAAA